MVASADHRHAFIVGVTDYPDTVLGCGALYLYAFLNISKVLKKSCFML